MVVRRGDNYPSVQAILVPLTTGVAVGLGIFLALVGGTSDVVAIAVGAGYFVVVQGLLQAIGVIAGREAWA